MIELSVYPVIATTCWIVSTSGMVSNSFLSHGRKVDGREEGNPVLRGVGLRFFTYFAVENSAWGVTYFSGCFCESSM